MPDTNNKEIIDKIVKKYHINKSYLDKLDQPQFNIDFKDLYNRLKSMRIFSDQGGLAEWPFWALVAFVGNLKAFNHYVNNKKDKEYELKDLNFKKIYLIHLAAWSGDLSFLQEAIRLQNGVQHRDHKQRNVLHFGALSYKPEIIEFLVIKELNPNTTDEDGKTPAHYALKNGDITMFYKLADLSLTVGKTINPLFIKPTKVKMTALHSALRSGNLRLVQSLLAWGKRSNLSQLNLNAKTIYGTTSLHFAAESGSVALARFVVKKMGLNLNDLIDCKNDFGETPLHYAILNGRKKMVCYLIEELGSDPNIVDNDGDIAIDYANLLKDTDFKQFVARTNNFKSLRAKYILSQLNKFTAANKQEGIIWFSEAIELKDEIFKVVMEEVSQLEREQKFNEAINLLKKSINNKGDDASLLALVFHHHRKLALFQRTNSVVKINKKINELKKNLSPNEKRGPAPEPRRKPSDYSFEL